MNDQRAFKPYSSLPEPFVLVAVVVLIDLLAAAWPAVTARGFVLRAGVYGALVAVAAAHSWFFARKALWSNASSRVGVTVAWLALLGGALAWVEWDSAAPLVGLLAFLQVAQCSFVFNHATLRLTHLVAFGAMLAATPHLPVAGGGVAWLAFAVLSMLVLAYGRTASKAGPAGYDQGETRRLAHRLTLVSGVAVLASGLFFVTPLLRWPESARPKRPAAERAQRPEPRGDDPFGIGGSTELDHENDDLQVMVVSTSQPVRGPLYLRGRTFDTFDGVNWSDAPSSEETVDLAPGMWTPLPFPTPRAKTLSFNQVTQTYTMLVNMRGVVFTAFRPTQVQFPDGGIDQVRYDVGDHSLRVDGSIPARTRYRVDGFQESFADSSLLAVSYATSPDDGGGRNLQLPAGIDPRVRQIAREQTDVYASPYQKALALERYLRTNYFYSLQHDVGGPEVVNDFLLEKKRGHCALFASAMVVMARSVGLPARYVTGFLAQDQSSDGFHVRGADGHAWVEVYVAGAGWIAFDPTSGRIDPSDTQTRPLAHAGGRSEDARADDRGERGSGLYGRDGRDFTPSGGSASGGDVARDGRGAAGNGTAGSDGAGGTMTGGPGGRPGGAGGGGPGVASGTGRGSGPGGATASDAGASPGQRASSNDSPAVANPNRTVVPPDGSTTLPRRAEQRGREPAAASADSAPRPVAPAPQRRADPTPDPEQLTNDWRLLTIVLLVVGAAGVVMLLVWQSAARRVAERRTIREALPLSVADDPDPRRFVVALYHAMVGGLGRVGYPKRESETPGDFAAAVARRDGSLGEPVGELTELFHVARYGDRSVTADDATRARGLWQRIAGSVKRVATADHGA